MRSAAAVLALLGALLHAPVAQAWFSDPDRGFGDVFQVLTPAAGLAVALYRGDSEGQIQWVYSVATTEIATVALKRATRNTSWDQRPDGTPGSFPSGHTAMACSGAAFLWDRYGAAYGAPAYVLAAYTGYSRVAHAKHHWRDVIAGCGLAMGVSRIFVTPSSEVSVAVWPTRRGAELTVELRWR